MQGPGKNGNENGNGKERKGTNNSRTTNSTVVEPKVWNQHDVASPGVTAGTGEIFVHEGSQSLLGT